MSEPNELSGLVEYWIVGCSHFARYIASMLVFLKARSLRSLTLYKTARMGFFGLYSSLWESAFWMMLLYTENWEARDRWWLRLLELELGLEEFTGFSISISNGCILGLPQLMSFSNRSR